MNSISFIEGYDAHGLYHPSKIVWRKPITAHTLADTLKSDKRRRVVRTSKKAQEKNIVIEWEEKISFASFQRFHAYYVAMMKKKEHGRIALEDSWYADRIEKEKKSFVMLSFMQDGIYFGGAIIEKKPDCLDICYVAYKKFSLAEYDLGLGCVLVDSVLQKAVEYNYTHIGYGRDRNLYGIELSLELLRYKRWYGFIPEIPKDNQKYSMQTLFITQPVDSPLVIFIQPDPQQNDLEFACITPDMTLSMKAYIPDSLQQKNILFMPEVIQKHSAYLSSI